MSPAASSECGKRSATLDPSQGMGHSQSWYVPELLASQRRALFSLQLQLCFLLQE